MKWTFYPTNKKLTTSLPLSVEINDYVGSPRVFIKEMGELELKKSKGGVRADFYMALPGKYTIEIRDQKDSYLKEIEIAEHNYLNFSNEFGFFFILFLIVMGGIVLWTIKIMKNRTE